MGTDKNIKLHIVTDIKVNSNHKSSSSMEDCIADIMINGIPDAWNNPLHMQNMYTLAQKGYTKRVSWKTGPFGIGLFAEERIEKGEVYRKYVDRKNMMVFRGEADFPPLTENTKKYLSNYMFQTD